jgi:hypothetical protein
MPDAREDRPRKNLIRLVAAWACLGALILTLVGSALFYGGLWLRERRRVQQFAEDLGSRETQKRVRAYTLLLELGVGAEDLLERTARYAPNPSRDNCQNLLKNVRNAPHSSVLDSLLWLACHQDADGSWSPGAFSCHCLGAPCAGPGAGDFTAGLTGLSLLAFLGAGYSHLSSELYLSPEHPGRVYPFGMVPNRAITWLLAHQAADGSIGANGPKGMYNHAIAALALSEAYGMTAARQFQGPAQRAIDYLVASQNPGKGWRYSARCGESDSSVTGWAVMALRSAELSDLTFPQSAYDGARAWYLEVMGSDSHQIGYTKKGPGGTSPEGKEGSGHHPSMEALGALSLYSILKNKGPAVTAATKLLMGDLPEWKTNRIDFTYWHFGSLMTFQFDGPQGPMWTRWSQPLKDALLPHQKTAKDGCANGSWDPEEDRWGAAGGRVYAVALNTLTLEVYYRYVNVFGGSPPTRK